MEKVGEREGEGERATEGGGREKGRRIQTHTLREKERRREERESWR